MTAHSVISILLPASILLVGVYDDIKTRKIHNKLVLACLAVAIIGTFFLGGTDALITGFLASFAAMALTLPFILMKALGAGDMKLLMAFAITSTWTNIFWIVVYAFIWGAVLGLFRALMDKQFIDLIKNTASLASKKKPSADSLHKIPFSVAMFFGWLTDLTLGDIHGGFLNW